MLSSSEEEEEQDEEELLQKALAEQASRDVRYDKRPAPVAPNGPPTRKAPMPPSQPPQRAPPPAEDDESEEELLSISSDDDDDAGAAARKAAAATPSKDSNLEIEDFSDDEEFEEEPKTWVKVDEEEITRRVRDMREARSSASAGRFKKAATVRMVGDSSYTREDLFDPLGLGTIDLKTLTLIHDAGTPSKRPSVQDGSAPAVRDHALREKVLYHSENFDPKVFLSRIHQHTSAEDLEHGEASLKVDLQNRKQQLKMLVKENFDCFVSCKNTIDDIHLKLRQIETDPEGAGTAYLTNTIKDVNEVAKRAFGPLLERQAQAERIRSVQGMLQRFRTLFNLPSTIRASINKGEYDMAVREYKKTKSLVLPSHGRILKRVFEEVEKVVQELKHMLSKCMEDPHADFSQLENAIRLLLELEPDSDPVWQYLNIQERRIRGILEGCVIEHESHMDALHGRAQQKLQSDVRWKQLQSESARASEVDMFLSSADEDKDACEDSTVDEFDVLLRRLIRRLTIVLIRYLPDFWRLAVSIFRGKFAKVSHQNVQKEETDDSDAENYPFEEKQTQVLRYTSHSLDEVVTMVQGIVASYEAKVHGAFSLLTEAPVMRDRMHDALTEVATACATLRKKDAAPAVAVQAISTLEMELMHMFISRFCSLIREKASRLVKEEDWVPVPAVERNGSLFSISSLPLRLCDSLNSTIEHMKDTLDKLKKDFTAEELHAHLFPMQDRIRTAFFECFLDVTELLDNQVMELTQADSSETNDPSPMGDKFIGLQMGVEVTSPSQRLLMILSNVGYMKEVLVPQLSKKHSTVWTHESSAVKGAEVVSPTEREVVESLSALEEKILNQYNYTKATSVGTAAAAYILDDTTQWSSAPPVKGVRDAVLELLHPLVAVHAEVFAGARPCIRKVICVLFEGQMDALVTTLSGNKSTALKHLDINGYCQLMLELDYVESVLKHYCTNATRSSLASLRELLLERVLEVSAESEGSGHHGRRTTEEDQIPLVPDEIQAKAHQVKEQFLPSELTRTRINVICFLETPDSIPDPRKQGVPAVLHKARKEQHSPPSQPQQQYGRHRRRSSGSSFSEEPGKAFAGLPPMSPYASSTDSSNSRGIARPISHSSRRGSLDDDFR